MKRHNGDRLRQVERQIKAVDDAILALIAEDANLKARFDILVSIPGLSQVTAFTLLIEMPELGELDEKAAAALAGLAPMSRQSGRWTGRAFIAGGRAIVHQALYMPALVACRFNPDLSVKYDQLKTAGKAPKVAITAIMRKLIVLANALLRKNRNGSRRWLDQHGYFSRDLPTLYPSCWSFGILTASLSSTLKLVMKRNVAKVAIERTTAVS